ncbi:MAG: sigma-54-dependent Fis family transcriptional regulator [Kiritimatiellae bacterium]|nr:sigma-54-dependent Fis family transcriptional regulator [Kiritimatiellia bacterium]
MARILVIDDQPMILKCLKMALSSDGHDVATVAAGDLAVKLLGQMPFDIIITDYAMPRMDGIEFLRIAQEKCPDVPVIMITGYGTPDTAIEAMTLGAFDYLPKPFSLEDLRATVAAANEFVRAMHGTSDLTRSDPAHFPFTNFVAASQAMKDVARQIEELAPSNDPILIRGEEGTGKELVARTIHAHSTRKDGYFARVDCASLAPGDSLIPLLDQAENGSVYFRNADKMPPEQQKELARILELKGYLRSGSRQLTPLKARILAGTSMTFDQLARGGLRHDLLHTLKPKTIFIPPLRERRDDIRVHIGRVLRLSKASPRDAAPIDPDTLLALENYSWPGNVPELEETVRNACAMARGAKVKITDLPREVVTHTKQDGTKAKGPLDMSPFRGKVVKSFLRLKEEEYRRIITDIEDYQG